MTDLLFGSPETLRQVQDAKLHRMLELCSEGHPYYRRRWAEAGVDIAAVRSISNIAKLPLTPKHDLMADPASFRLSCPGLPVHERTLWEVLHTTGTTSDPTPIFVTTHDFNGYLFIARRVAEISGINECDTIANLFPLAQAAMGAFVRSAELAYAVGASVCAALTGASYGSFGNHRSLDDAVRLIERHRATVLWGLTSFVRRVLIRAEELQADFTSVRMCAVTGEASSVAMRNDMRARMRSLGTESQIIFDRYGSTESGGLAQCREEGEWHNPAPELLYHEVVDPDTGRPLADGERGWLALTHLDHRGTVVMRYLVGDIVSITHQRCPHCGRTGERLVGPVVRSKDLVKVKGMLINPEVLMESIAAIEGVDEFQISVLKQNRDDPFSMDEILVRIATKRTDTDDLAATVARVTTHAVGVKARLEVVSPDAIYDPTQQAKASRFIDLRPTITVPAGA
jgi:phenylacetate-CoA ligase